MATCPKCGGVAKFHVILSTRFSYERQSHWRCPKCGWVPVSDEKGRVADYPKAEPQQEST